MSRALMSMAILCVALHSSASGFAAGYWHTSGNRILDASGDVIQIHGVNWNGFDGDNYILHGLWGGVNRPWLSMLDQLDGLGFNTIRLAFSGEMLDAGRMPLNIDYGTNPDLTGKSSIEIMDMFIDACTARGIRVILDYHRIAAGSAPESGLWYDAAHPQSMWIDNWKMLVTRYDGNATVVGAELFNEPHQATWDADGANLATNWRVAARTAADEILAINPDLLIFVQGLASYQGDAGWWGGVHLGLRDHPLSLSVPNRLVYTVHDYPESVWVQPWYEPAAYPEYPEHMTGIWDHYWGFVHNEEIAPIWISELGTKYETLRDQQWFHEFRDYINQRGLNWTYWLWNPNSWDTGGILTDNWTTIHEDKMAVLRTMMDESPVDPTNNAPTLDSPPSASPQPATSGEAVTFTATAADLDGDTLSYSWISSLDGAIGSAAAFSVSTLQVGTHTISLTVSDGRGGYAHGSVELYVTGGGANLPDIEIMVSEEPATPGSTAGTISFSTDGYGLVVMDFSVGALEGVTAWMPVDGWESIDLTEYFAAGAFLEFYVMSNNTLLSNSFSIGLADADETAGIVSLSSYVTPDGSWQLVRIPLPDIELGAPLLDVEHVRVLKWEEWPTDGIEVSLRDIRVTTDSGSIPDPDPVLTSIAITPAAASLVGGESVEFIAVTLDQYGALFAATVNWTVSGGGSLQAAQGATTTFESDMTAGTFTVTAASGAANATATITVAAATMNVTNPVGGEVWYVGMTRPIEWETNVTSVDISYRTDPSGGWRSIASAVGQSDAMWLSYRWVVSDAPSETCEILVADHLTGTILDTSGVFEIATVLDADGDSMDDDWETEQFGDLSHDGTDDTDGDGQSDLQEFVAGTDPTVSDAPAPPSTPQGSPGMSCAARGTAAAGALAHMAMMMAVAVAALLRRRRGVPE